MERWFYYAEANIQAQARLSTKLQTVTMRRTERGSVRRLWFFLCVLSVIALTLLELVPTLAAATTDRPIQILTQPLSRTARVGDSLMFFVDVIITGPIGYQWQLNGLNLSNTAQIFGVNQAGLILSPVSSNLSGIYTVVLTNTFGRVTSAPAMLTVQPADLRWQAVPVTSFPGYDPNYNDANGGLIQGDDEDFYGTTRSLLIGATNGPYGTVFRVTTNGALTTLHTFTGGTNGGNPVAGLIQDASGNLYGATPETVFRLTKNGEFANLGVFTNAMEGSNILDRLVFGPDRALYGTAESAGSGNDGTIFRITTNGVITVLHAFTGGVDGRYPTAGLTLGNDGNFYGTTSSGGAATNAGTVFKITTNGDFTTLHVFTGGADGGTPRASLTLGPEGDLYGVTSTGGFGTNQILGPPGPGPAPGTVFRITPDGTLTPLFSFTMLNRPGFIGANPVFPLTLGRDGSLYGVTSENRYGSVAFRITTDGVFTVLYGFPNLYETGYPSGSLIEGTDGRFYGATILSEPLFWPYATNQTVIFALAPIVPPTYPTPARNYTATAGASLMLDATPSGSAPFGYQWLFNGTNLAGATNQILTLPDLEPSSAGLYGVIVSNLSGSATGQVASVAVQPAIFPWGFQTIHSFQFGNGNSVSGYPPAPLAQGPDGTFYGISARGGPAGQAIIYRVDTNGGFTILHTFTVSLTGQIPGGLTLGLDDNLYVAVSSGGQYGDGYIMRISTGGVVTNLYQFSGGTNGANPRSGLTLGLDGNFYGVTLQPFGGSIAIFFQLSTNGALTTLNRLSITQQISSLTLGPDGNFYGGTLYGSTFGALFSLTPGGAFSTLYNFTGHIDGAGPIPMLAVGPDANLYGAASSGASFYGGLFKVTTNGVLTPLYSFTGGHDGGNPASGLVSGSDGVLYGATIKTIYQITPDGLLTTLYTFHPRDVASGSRIGLVEGLDGNLYGVSDGGGTATGSVFRLLRHNPFPVITAQPVGQTATVAGAATLTVAAAGNGPFTYQWQFNGTNIWGATGATLTLTNLMYGQAGSYSVVVSNSAGLAASGAAVLKVVPPTPPLVVIPIHTFTGGLDGAYPNGGLIQGADGYFYGTTTSGGGTNEGGTFFRVNTNGDLFVLHAFIGGTYGQGPSDRLMLANDGSFYGTTGAGGSNGLGTLFRLDTNGLYTTLHTFAPEEGHFPQAGLVQGADGAFYGTTTGPQVAYGGTVFRFETNGDFRTLYNFTNTLYGGNPFAALIQGNDGLLYGTTAGGLSTNQPGIIFSITTNGDLAVLHTFRGGLDGATTFSPLLQASDGNFYGTTSRGGATNLGTVFKLGSDGTFSILYSFTGPGDGGNPNSALIEGRDGNLYGTTSGTAFQITTNGLLTTLATFTYLQGYNAEGPLVQGADGAFYGITGQGGPLPPVNSLYPSYGEGTVYVLRARATAGPAQLEISQNAGGPPSSRPLLVKGLAGLNYRIDTTSDLSDTNSWITWTNIFLLNTPTSILDNSLQLPSVRFYRAVLLP